ncbi:MAG: PD-(D/E)XK nuclease family protein [Chloroflexota bacterium]
MPAHVFPTPHVSPSQLKAYQGCPHAWAKVYVDGWPRLSNPAANDGVFVHEVLQRYFEILRATREPSAPDLLESLFLDAMVVCERPVSLESAPRLGQMLGRFGSRFRLPDDYGDLLIEHPFVEQCGTASWPVCGLIDLAILWPNRARVIDWKTGWWMIPAKDRRDDIQVRTYAFAIARQFPEIASIEVDLYYHQWDEQQREPVVFSRDEALEYGDLLEAMIKRIQADTEHAPEPGNHCIFCPYAPDCPAGRRSLACDSDESARSCAEQLLVIERTRALLLGGLKGWLQEREPLRVGDYVFGFEQQTRTTVSKRDTKAFFDRLSAAGLDPWKHLKVDTTGLRAIDEKLRGGLVHETPHTVFRHDKADDDEEEAK